MALIAVTDINYCNTDGDEPEHYYVEAGEEVDESKFTDEDLEELKANGAVEESAHREEVNELRKQVEELQAKLAAAESEHAGMNNDLTNARAVDQTAPDPLHGVPAGTIIDQSVVDERNLKGVTPIEDIDEAESRTEEQVQQTKTSTSRPESPPTAADRTSTTTRPTTTTPKTTPKS